MELLEFIKDWGGAIAILISVGGSLYAFLTRRSDANSKKLANHERKLIEHDRRVQKIENEFEHLPSKDMAHRLELGMTRLNGRIDTLTEAMKPIDAISKRLQEWAMDNGAPK